jgi:hypothetical protein
MKHLRLFFALAALVSSFGCSDARKYRDDRYWTEHVAGDIKLQAPVDIYRSRKMEKEAESDGPSTAVIYTSTPDKVFRVVVSRIDVLSEIELDIDRMIAGGDRAMSESIGDSSPVVTSSPCEWRGVVCRRGSFTAKDKGRPFRVLSLHLLRDRTLWSVSVGYSDEADKTYAERVLNSVGLIQRDEQP